MNSEKGLDSQDLVGFGFSSELVMEDIGGFKLRIT